ncbi:hypothetical protein VYU27_000726 [Nannochloropsis oceanica]
MPKAKAATTRSRASTKKEIRGKEGKGSMEGRRRNLRSIPLTSNVVRCSRGLQKERQSCWRARPRWERKEADSVSSKNEQEPLLRYASPATFVVGKNTIPSIKGEYYDEEKEEHGGRGVGGVGKGVV